MSYLGKTNYNNFGSKMKVIRYRNKRDIDIYFEEYDWIYYNAEYSVFKNGKVACPYEPRVYGKGYLGEGKYLKSENGKHTKYYDIWNKMLQRCYDIKYHEKYPTYKNCEVEKYFLNFQNFCKWCDINYYEIKDERIELDKDILNKGNKIYSRENCIFVPRRINTLIVNRKNDRGNLPIGVSYEKDINKFKASCGNKGKRINLGRYNTPEEAFQVYKSYKENLIKQVAEEYKDLIPIKLYNALYNWEVDIND